MADDLGEAEFLARAKAALERGLALVQIREKGWPAPRQQALVAALVALARPRGAKVLWNGDVERARAVGLRWRALDVGRACHCDRAT